MIYLREVAADTFVVLEADMRAGQTREILNTLPSATHLIVHHAGEPETYYLVRRAAALNQLTRARKRSPLTEALGLARLKPTPVLDADADTETAPDCSIVVEGGQVIGFAQRKRPSKQQVKKGRESPIGTKQPGTESSGDITGAEIQEMLGGQVEVEQEINPVEGELTGAEIQEMLGGRVEVEQEINPVEGESTETEIDLIGSPIEPGTLGQIGKSLVQRPQGIRGYPPSTGQSGRFERQPIQGRQRPQGWSPLAPPGRAFKQGQYQGWQQSKGYSFGTPYAAPLEKGRVQPPGAPARGPAAGEPVTRWLVSTFRDRVRLGATRVLRVTLSAQGETGTGTLRVKAKLGSRITVLVEPERGFELKGDNRGTLKVSTKEETLQFKLKATALGPALIWVYAYQGANPLGRMRVLATVVAADEPLRASTGHSSQPIPSLDVRQPDLLLEIHQLPSAAGPGIQMYLAAQDPALHLELRPFPAVSFKKDVEAYYREIFADIEGMLLDTPEHCRDAQLALESAGYDLFETLFPPELRTEFWRLKERIKTVRIVSNEPWIPWELCKLEDEQHEPGPFLCEAFAVTRWILGMDSQPELTLRKMAVVAPEQSGLPHAPEEWTYLHSLAEGSRQVERIPARFAPLLKALGEGVYDGWHFAGHGELSPGDPNNSSIELDDYQSLKPRNLSGTPMRLGQARPLVFLNACQAGRGAMSLTGMGGWAYKFLSAQAAAFISTHWSIDDGVALQFAVEFYDRLLKQGLTIGEAARQARLAARDAHPGDPTWLAYVVYADPMATVH
jgi:hypothetical protein